MKILVEEQHDLPLVEVEVVSRSGPSSDPGGKEGLARHCFELVRRGAGGRSRAELDGAFDALGAQVEPVPSHDAVAVRATCLSRNLEAVLELLGDVVCRPHLAEDEHLRLKREELAVLDEVRDDDASLAARFFDRLALAGTPYGRSPLGSEVSLGAIERVDAVAWVERSLPAENVLVGFAGDVEEARATELARAVFASLAAGERPSPPGDVAPPPRGRRTFLVDKPERAQSQIILGHAAPRAADADFLPLHVACTAFGGTFTSRLMREVRVKRGWSYGASFRAARARGGHSLRLRVFPAAEQTPDTLALVIGLCEEVVAQGLSDEEIAHAKSYLEGSWAFEVDTPGERLDRRMEIEVLGLPADHLETFVPRLRALDPSAVNGALARHFRPSEAVIVLTATAEDMLPRLAGLPLGEVEVVDFASY
jgi:zinc protease